MLLVCFYINFVKCIILTSILVVNISGKLCRTGAGFVPLFNFILPLRIIQHPFATTWPLPAFNDIEDEKLYNPQSTTQQTLLLTPAVFAAARGHTFTGQSGERASLNPTNFSFAFP